MANPPLPVGTHGKVRFYPHPHPDGKAWRATTKYRDTDGVTRPVTRTGKSKAAAERNLKAALLDRAGTTHTGDLRGNTRFSVVADLWLDEVKATRAGTSYDTYRRNLTLRVLPSFAGLHLREITVAVTHRYLRDLERAELSPWTVRSCRTVLSGVLAFAVQQGAIPTNPVREAGRIEGASEPARALTAAELDELLRKLDADPVARADDVPDMVRFMLGTGMRIGETLGLRWWRVDLAGRELVAGPVLVRHTGEGLITHDGGKSAAAVRAVPLPDFVVSMLRDRVAKAGEVDPMSPVFPNRRGGWRDPNNTQRVWRRARSAAGFGWVKTHVFRKTAVTILDERGLSAREIAGHVGHARPSITLDTYMDKRARGRSAAEALQAALDP